MRKIAILNCKHGKLIENLLLDVNIFRADVKFEIA